MFGLSFWEILIIVGVVLVFAGPTVVPRLGRYLGKTLTGLQKGAADFSDQLIEGMEKAELPEPDDAKKDESKADGDPPKAA